jgi:hypothetical protein
VQCAAQPEVHDVGEYRLGKAFEQLHAAVDADARVPGAADEAVQRRIAGEPVFEPVILGVTDVPDPKLTVVRPDADTGRL